MTTKLSSIKLAIDALNRRVDVLDELIGTTPVTEENDKKVLQYSEDLENCRIAIEDMKRLKEEWHFKAAIDNPTNTGGFDPIKHPLPWKRTFTNAALDEQ